MAIVVVHGDSEEQIVKHIKSNLRLNIYIHKRQTSIQINGLMHELRTNFGDINALKKIKSIELPIINNRICTEDFKIFTLMDTDDCLNETRKQYVDKSLFCGYPLFQYIVPIYNTPNLENVLYKGNIIPKVYNNHEKMRNYAKIFPIARNPSLGAKKEDDMQKLFEILEAMDNTNMELFIKYCLKQAEKNKVI